MKWGRDFSDLYPVLIYIIYFINNFSQDSEEDDLPLDKIITNASNPQLLPQEKASNNPTDIGAGPSIVDSSNNESSKALPGEQYFL